MIILILFIIISLVIIVNDKAIIKVPFDQVFVIERLNKYYKLTHHGINIIIPMIDTIRAKVYIGEKLLDIPECSCFTKDNKQINAKRKGIKCKEGFVCLKLKTKILHHKTIAS
jgi:regulator of protease activity HflC (stomatin/prohibitin superfamily)